MSLFLDQKYLLLVSNRLPLFKKKNDATYNCRCILCGDSSKKVKKARGYFFQNKNNLMYKCFNCDASMFFGTFLKQLDGNLYNQYSLENYTEGKPLLSNTATEFTFEQPTFKTDHEKLFDKLLTRLDLLPEDHEVVKFCHTRQISKHNFKKLYFIDNIKNIVEFNDKYKLSIRGEEPRLVLPFYDENGELSGFTCRAIRGEALRYITVKINDDSPLIFGLKDCNANKDIFVLEGPIDSLFVDNAVAISGTSFGKLTLTSLPREKMVLVFDNQPRNKEVCAIVEKCIEQGYRVVIWPQSILEKDVNEMVLAGKDVNKIIKQNIHQGLEAKVSFIGWKRC